ncbi:MAG: hypothetical protein NTV43_18090 [Methylococcales bacterium]|nr:hypothetical protein [Methylococcales bacterium]
MAIINEPSSSYCVSPAYIFLLPTYAVMWITGRDLAASKQTPSFKLGKIPEFTAWLTLATILAFLISNASFYWLSGYFKQLSWIDYAVRVADYLPTYVGSSLVYGLAGLLAICLFQPLLSRDAKARTDMDED